MNSKMFKTLEFDKIKNMIKNRCITYLGVDKTNNLFPSGNIDIVSNLQLETTEALSLLIKKTTLPLCEISNISSLLEKINMGGFLNIKELLQVEDILRIGRKLKEYYNNDKIDISNIFILNIYFENLYSNKNIEDEIYRCIKSEDELNDRASSELYNIRRKIQSTENTIKEKLDNIIHSASNSKYLQDTIVTFRNDRYVVPVKQEYKNNIPGFVHDISSSGSTVFIEPTAVFNLNNEIRELRLKEQLEIERILASLTQMIDPITSNIETSLIQMGNIDFAFAKAKLSLDLDSYSPILNNKGYINLKKARHPLIDKNAVVPIDIWIGDSYSSLIITGPNTGGKTVTLKTIGLLSLMAQSGLHIPASESSEVCVFNEIYTDIGDEQSIEQSLSTFSSHMTNIVSILNNVSSGDLVLLDELGSGTDPIEGAALAMAILEFFHSKNVITVATTHYSELKSFAIQKEGFENASCEFDIKTLKPTYKLLIGIPGKSNAFAISKRLGLKDNILTKASEFLSSETIRFEDVLGDMEYNRKKAKEEKDLYEKLLEEITLKKANLFKEEENLKQSKDKILSNAKIEARDILIEAQEKANEIIKELTSFKKSRDININKKTEESRNKIKKNINDIQKDLITPNENINKEIAISEIKIGMKVFIPSLNQEATVLSNVDKNGNIAIQSGIVKLNVHISQIRLITEYKNDKSKITVNSLVQNKAYSINSEIKLLGFTVDEAINELEKYLDDAYLANLPQIRIVHGKGSGSLRTGIHAYLKNHPHIKSFKLASFGEGDTGVTIVEIKK